MTNDQMTKVKKYIYAGLCVIGTLTVGVSLGLPLYLFLRETGRERAA